jgi:Glu-tRNA(Gln) amidotransferase subunit E-like FAD-binding protein
MRFEEIVNTLLEIVELYKKENLFLQNQEMHKVMEMLKEKEQAQQKMAMVLESLQHHKERGLVSLEQKNTIKQISREMDILLQENSVMLEEADLRYNNVFGSVCKIIMKEEQSKRSSYGPSGKMSKYSEGSNSFNSKCFVNNAL